MNLPRLLFTAALLTTACADKATDTNNISDETTGSQTDTAPGTTGEAPGSTGVDPSGTGGSTGIVDPTAESTSSASTDPTTTAGETTGCAGDCGVSVESAFSSCDENDPDPVMSSLMATPVAPGAIEVTESGFETSCCLELDPQVAVDGMTLNITYTEIGDPCDCICFYTIDTVLSGLAPGTWTVVSGAQMVDVEVQ